MDRDAAVAATMAAGLAHPAVQLAQTRYRLGLVDAWRIAPEAAVDTTRLQDADWEVGAALSMVNERRDRLAVPIRDFVDSLVDQLRAAAQPDGNEPLPSYALTAEPVAGNLNPTLSGE